MTEYLVKRLRGEYRIPTRDGLGPVGGAEPDNPNWYVRHFETPPIQKEAADAIERLTRERDEALGLLKANEDSHRAAIERAAKLEEDNADLLVLWESDECFVNGGRVIANFSHYGADAEEVPDAEIGVVADLVRRFGDEAVVSWICHKRGLDNPIKGNFTEKQRAANEFLRARKALEETNADQ